MSPKIQKLVFNISLDIYFPFVYTIAPFNLYNLERAMGLKHSNGYYRLEKSLRQERYEKEDQEKEYLKRQEEAFNRLNESFNKNKYKN